MNKIVDTVIHKEESLPLAEVGHSGVSFAWSLNSPF
jgi:hypothetical protein